MLLFGRFGWRGIGKCSIIKSKAAEEIVESIVWTVLEWVCKRKEFAGISLEDLNRSWASVLEGAWHIKIVHKMIWAHPPSRIS